MQPGPEWCLISASHETKRRNDGFFSGLLCRRVGFLLDSNNNSARTYDYLSMPSALVVGLMFTLVSAVAGHFFGGHDAIGRRHRRPRGGGFRQTACRAFHSSAPRCWPAFVTAFGAFGLIFSSIDATSSVWVSAPLSLVGGLVMAARRVSGCLNTMFSKTQSSSESHVATLIGQTAAIVTPIPENGVGEIAYVQSGTRYTAPARRRRAAPSPPARPSKSPASSARSFTSNPSIELQSNHQPQNSIHYEHHSHPCWPEHLPWMTVVIGRGRACCLVIFIFVVIWASRYTKVGPNQVLVVSGRKHQ